VPIGAISLTWREHRRCELETSLSPW